MWRDALIMGLLSLLDIQCSYTTHEALADYAIPRLKELMTAAAERPEEQKLRALLDMTYATGNRAAHIQAAVLLKRYWQGRFASSRSIVRQPVY